MAFKVKLARDDGPEVGVNKLWQVEQGHYVMATRGYAELYNHEGDVFILTGSIDTLDQNHSFDVLIQVGKKELHMLSIKGHVSGKAHGYIYKDTKFSAAGNTLTPLCANDTARASSSAIVTGGSSETNNMTITDNGTLWVTTHFAANQGRALNATDEVNVELILRKGTNYLIKLDNEEVTDIQVTSQLIWVEKD